MTWNWSWWGWLLSMVVGALLLAFTVFVVVRLVLIPIIERTEREPGAEPSEAIAILRERYAEGEIDEEEFERRVEFLRKRKQ